MRKLYFVLLMCFLLFGCSTSKETSLELTDASSESIDASSESADFSTTAEIIDVYVIQKNEYDETGQLQRETFYDENGEGLIYESERIEYTYDTFGNVVAKSTIGYSSSGVYEILFEYDNDNRLCKVYSDNNLTELYEYDKNGNLINKYCYNRDGTLINSEEYVYDKSSLLSASYMHTNYDIYEDAEGYYQYIFQRDYIYEVYDQDGRLSKVTSYYHNEEPFYELYTYKNQQTIIQDYSFDGTRGLCTTLDYDDQGRKIRHLISEPNGEVWFLKEYEYTDFSEKTISYNSDGDVTHSSLSEWDEQGRKTFEVSYDAEGNLQASLEYIYDDHGYIASIISTDPNGNTSFMVAPHREFYDNGVVKSEVLYNNETYIAPIYRKCY